jgi:hypothetical protein
MPTIYAEGPPSQEEVLIDENGVGHNFGEESFDIMVSNNSNWEIQDPMYDIDNMTTWLNNTWNVKWISHGNFEMGFLSFMNKSGDDRGDNKYYTPAQFWWMHYYYEGHEMLVGNLLSGWYGFEDLDGDHIWDEGVEELHPLMYLSMVDPSYVNTTAFPGLSMNPKVEVDKLSKSVQGDTIKYQWAVNYTDMAFFVPHKQTIQNAFDWGFNYSDPGTYVNGSFAFGIQEFVYYEYILTLNDTSRKATLESNYIGGEIKQLYIKQDEFSGFVLTGPSDPDYMPSTWHFHTANWVVVKAGIDEEYTLTNSTGGRLDKNVTSYGLSQIKAFIGSLNVFNYDFISKPTYTIYENGNPSNFTVQPVEYNTLDTENEYFTNFIAGMANLIGSFARLMLAYAINQTNHFISGITFENAWDIMDPFDCSVLYVQGYPLFGEYKGGRIEHDPLYIANYTPGSGWGLLPENGIPGYNLVYLVFSLLLGLVFIEIIQRRKTTLKSM